MLLSWWVVVAVAAVLVGLALAWRPLRRLGADIQSERARELFLLQRERIQPSFLPAAMATGKPRGLRWRECVFGEEVAFARDRQSGEVIALASVTIRFEAIEGGDMEGLPAVPLPRNASAVFFFRAGQWHTAGKAVFNLNPGEATRRLAAQYEPIEPVRHANSEPVAPADPAG